jgi:hypothetical protein
MEGVLCKVLNMTSCATMMSHCQSFVLQYCHLLMKPEMKLAISDDVFLILLHDMDKNINKLCSNIYNYTVVSRKLCLHKIRSQLSK